MRQALVSVAFGATSIFFIRWHNSWFERHAAEEFRLKRLDLDIDRASWIVETALEWQNVSGGSTIPEGLLSKLAHGIFVEERNEGAEHPAESLGRALLDSAKRVSLKTPIGEAEFDRKGLNMISKQRTDG